MLWFASGFFDQIIHSVQTCLICIVGKNDNCSMAETELWFRCHGHARVLPNSGFIEAMQQLYS